MYFRFTITVKFVINLKRKERQTNKQTNLSEKYNFCKIYRELINSVVLNIIFFIKLLKAHVINDNAM